MASGDGDRAKGVDVESCEAWLSAGAGGEQLELDDVAVGIEAHDGAGDAEVLCLVGLGAGAPVATAALATASVTTCTDELTALGTDVAAAPITSGKVEKERAGLVKLVGDATALLESGKVTDALVKLANLQTKVDELAAAGRISAESAALLTADVRAATACISPV